jgi:PAS domain-containing protein
VRMMEMFRKRASTASDMVAIRQQASHPAMTEKRQLLNDRRCPALANETWEELLSNLPVGITICNGVNGLCLYMNPKAAEFFPGKFAIANVAAFTTLISTCTVGYCFSSVVQIMQDRNAIVHVVSASQRHAT